MFFSDTIQDTFSARQYLNANLFYIMHPYFYVCREAACHRGNQTIGKKVDNNTNTGNIANFLCQILNAT